MAKTKNMEGLNEQIVEVGETKSNRGLIAKVAVGVLGAAAGLGLVLFCKKKKGQTTETEDVNLDNANDGNN